MTTLEIVKRAKKEIEKAISTENSLIGKAFDTAQNLHEGQLRKSG